MHLSHWKQEYDKAYGCMGRVYGFVSDTDYSAAMLAEDLLEAGMQIRYIYYEENAGAGERASGEEFTPDDFLRQYDALKVKGPGTKSYNIRCQWRETSFEAVTADNKDGKPVNRISFKFVPSERAMRKILGKLGKI